MGTGYAFLPIKQVDLWPSDLESGVRVTCDVAYLCANFRLPRPLCSRLRPDVCDRQRQTSDVHHRLMPPPYGGGGITTTTQSMKMNTRLVHSCLIGLFFWKLLQGRVSQRPSNEKLSKLSKQDLSQMPVLLPKQHCQSTEIQIGIIYKNVPVLGTAETLLSSLTHATKP